jgi:hypothetical protein
VTFTSASQPVAEVVGTVSVTATLSAASGLEVDVPFTISGTATAGGTDHNLAAGNIIIPAGQTSGTTNFIVTDDAIVEGDETVIVTMGSLTNATVGAESVHTVTIMDNDAVSFTNASQSTVVESGTATITAQLSAASSMDVIVPFTVNGSSTATGSGMDYSITASPVTITAGNTTADITVTITEDADVEGPETVIVDMGSPTNAAQGAVTTHTLTITDDDSGGGPTVTVCVSPAGDFATIQAAIDDSGTTDSMTVLVCEDTYSENINYGSKKIIIKAEGSVANTIIQGTSGNNTAVVTFNNTALDITAVLDGFTIDNQGTGCNSRGIYIGTNAAPTIKNSRIVGNTPGCSRVGGGIYIDQGGMILESSTVGGSGTPNTGAAGAGIYAKTAASGPYAIHISNSTISYNNGKNGGGIYFDTSFNGTVNISGSTISNNIGSGNSGAGIYSAVGLTFINTNIINNYDTNSYLAGGGLYLTGTDKVTTFTGGSISGNTAENGGGGIYVAGGADLTINGGAVVSGNVADAGKGGGINVNGESSTLTCSKAFFKGNDAQQYGGGISLDSSASVSLTNCIVSGNTADGETFSDGGGIYNNGATLTLMNTTVSGNYALRYGGGLQGGGTITNSIFWANTADTTGPQINGTPTITYSDIEGGFTGTGNINLDPVFVISAQASSGSATIAGDFHIQFGSNVIDQGTATGARPMI